MSIRFLIVLFIVVISSFAEDGAVKYEVKIIEKIVIDITGKENPKVCTVNYPSVYIQNYSSNLILTNCNQADIVISSSNRELNYNKPTIEVGTPQINNPNVIGLIFWRKGRPQIIFIEKNLKKFDIQLPEEYKKYIIKKELIDYAKADF